jgi:hypothetical protein
MKNFMEIKRDILPFSWAAAATSPAASFACSTVSDALSCNSPAKYFK